MTAAKKSENPFDVLDEKVEPKTDNKVVETDESKAGTEQDKPAEPEKATTRKPAAKKVTKAKKADFETLSLEQPLSAVSGQVTGTVTNNDTAVPVLKLALSGWIGVEPLSLPAKNGFDDVRKVLDELEKQAAAL